MTLHEFEDALREKRDLTTEIAKLWKRRGLLALVSPIYPHCAPKCSQVDKTGLFVEYSLMWNLTGFPAGVLPVTRVREDEQSFMDQYNDASTEAINEIAKDSKGMPISVQVVGYKYEDEHVLKVMKDLSKVIGYSI